MRASARHAVGADADACGVLLSCCDEAEFVPTKFGRPTRSCAELRLLRHSCTHPASILRPAEPNMGWQCRGTFARRFASCNASAISAAIPESVR